MDEHLTLGLPVYAHHDHIGFDRLDCATIQYKRARRNQVCCLVQAVQQ
jgi:hypothetical protein